MSKHVKKFSFRLEKQQYLESKQLIHFYQK